jgi:hypothetical protein
MSRSSSGNWNFNVPTGEEYEWNENNSTTMTLDGGDLSISGAFTATGAATATSFVSSGGPEWFANNGNWYTNNALFVGDTANANMTIGLTINQGAADNQILALKSSDVAHGQTSIAGGNCETDDFFTIQKQDATGGGVVMNCLAENSSEERVLDLWVAGGQADTDKTTSSFGLMTIFAMEHDGSNARADIAADGNVFAIKAHSGGAFVTRFLVDEDGDMYSATTGQTFDEHDDLQLVRNYDVVRRDSLRNSYSEFASGYEDELIALGVLGAPIADGGMTNVTQLQRLHNGALVQLNGSLKALESREDRLENCLRGLVAANPTLEGRDTALALLEMN